MKLLILDSGHSEYVQGKEAPDKSMKEWEFNNDMQHKIKTIAEKQGITVYLTNPNPSKKNEMGLTRRAQYANDYWISKGKPDALFFSIHSNAYDSKFNAARGTETYYASNASQKSKNAAKDVQEEVYKVMKSIDSEAKDRGVKVADFTVIYKALMPSILEEYGFYTNREDLKILKNNRDELAEATVKGVCKYFGITYKEVGGNPPSESQTPGEDVYENCIIYKGDVDKNIANILGWGLKDYIIVPLQEYKVGLGKKVFVVGVAANEIEGDVNLQGNNRWDTLNEVLEYLGK
ncbi:N-acetylmuramoyl-L-alanine amidase family protein [Faecalimicrobium dakarense]|uniref:N-acetylmuramoyl-L-alanine amidase family protein n=1 Tax=Faecalimicrobium dakarense TaxID=1301100 RepID=UPI0004B5289B|nr:N-acetylmuramoyl-L-alanine amidase [[Clostridium] dakarense]